MTALSLFSPQKSVKVMVLAGSLDVPMSINKNSDCKGDTEVTKENKATERAQFTCFQGGGVSWGQRWTLVQSEEPLMQVEALNKQLLDSWNDVIIYGCTSNLGLIYSGKNTL